MIKFDRKFFSKAANEVLDDVQDGELRSQSWKWLATGAILGFLSSCMRVTKESGKPILARFKRIRKMGRDE